MWLEYVQTCPFVCTHGNRLIFSRSPVAKSVTWIRSNLSVCLYTWKSAHTGWIFTKFDMSIFRKSAEKIKVSLKLNKNNGYYKWRPIYIFITSLSVILRMRNVSDKSCRENQRNTHFMFSDLFFENLAVYDTTWKNSVQPGRPQVTDWRHVQSTLGT